MRDGNELSGRGEKKGLGPGVTPSIAEMRVNDDDVLPSGGQGPSRPSEPRPPLSRPVPKQPPSVPGSQPLRPLPTTSAWMEASHSHYFTASVPLLTLRGARTRPNAVKEPHADTDGAFGASRRQRGGAPSPLPNAPKDTT